MPGNDADATQPENGLRDWGTEPVPSVHPSELRDQIADAEEHLERAERSLQEAREEMREARQAIDDATDGATDKG